MQHDESGDTFFWKGKYHYDLNNRDTLDTQLNVFENFDPVIPEEYRDNKYIALGNIEPGLQESVLEQVDNPGFVVLDTMNFRSEEHTSELQSRGHLVCRLLLEKKNKQHVVAVN